MADQNKTKSKTLHVWLLFLTIFFLVGCGSNHTEFVSLGPAYQSRTLSNSEARIIVLWPTDAMSGSSMIPRVLINGIDVGKLEPLGYTDAIVSPGQVTVAVRSMYTDPQDGSMTKAAGSLAVFGKPASEVFLEYSVGFGLNAPGLHLKELPASEAATKVKLVRKTVNN